MATCEGGMAAVYVSVKKIGGKKTHCFGIVRGGFGRYQTEVTTPRREKKTDLLSGSEFLRLEESFWDFGYFWIRGAVSISPSMFMYA